MLTPRPLAPPPPSASRIHAQMVRRTLPLNNRSYTVVLGSLCSLAAESTNIVADRAKRLAQGQQIFARIEARPEGADIIHHNAMLKLCKECLDAGGMEAAHELYDRMPERDVITYTLMLKLCSRRGKRGGSWLA
jgi:hypothetical protein